jgi:hypothetical protein
MSKGNRRLSRQPEPDENRDRIGDKYKPKRSLGKLRPHHKTKPNSADATGAFNFQRHTLKAICSLLKAADADEVVCNIAGWRNSDHHGAYITIEVSPKFIRGEQQPSKRSFFDDIFETEG